MKRHANSRNVIEPWLSPQANKRHRGRAMKMAAAQINRFLIAAMAAAVALQPASCCAATAAELPWDRPLEALQETLIGPVTHALIAMSFVGAVFVYAIFGDGDIARRLAKAGLGVGVALGMLRLMDYLVP